MFYLIFRKTFAKKINSNEFSKFPLRIFNDIILLLLQNRIFLLNNRLLKMKKILIFFLVLSFSFSTAQSITINWDGSKEFTDGEKPVATLPFFTNSGYSASQNSVYFMYSEPTQGLSKVDIRNVQYENLSASDRGSLDLNSIPDKLEYLAKVSKGVNGYTLNVGMVPFVNENGQIKKVTSFEIGKSSELLTAIQSQGTFDPATQSVLKSGNWYKIKIKKSGIFKLDKNFFQQNNIPSNFDPRTLKVYGNGGKMLNENPGDFRYGALQENAIQFVGEEDGSFDSGDFVLFYGQGPHDWNRLEDSSLNTLTHRFNQFSDYAYYFITFGGEQGKRVQDLTIEGNPVETFQQYEEYQFHEKDSINMNLVGRQWVGENFSVNPSQSFTLNGGGPVAGEFRAKYRLVGRNASGVSYSGSLNGTSLQGGNFSSGLFAANYKNEQINTSGNSFTYTFNVTDSSNPGSFVFLDYVEVVYSAALTFNGSQMQFRKLQDLNDGNVYGFQLSGAPKVWNISDITSSKNVPSTNGIYKYKSDSPFFKNEFIAFSESAAFTEIEYVGTVVNQNIRALTDIEYAIVVHPNFLSEASRLANFRAQNDGVKVAVVTTEQVYNEFSSGGQDLSAIRDFFKHLKDSGSPLKYAVLFGGASFDYKDRTTDNTNFVPSYISFESTDLEHSYVSDDFFTMLDDSDIILKNNYKIGPTEYNLLGSAQMDIAVGRFPANNLTEAKTMVNKTLAYYEKLPGQGTSFGDWKTKFLLVVDDDKGAGPFHQTIENTSAQFITDNIDYATLRKGYLDSFILQTTSGGGRYPQVNQLITNSFNLGTSLIVYFGHGGARSWSQKRVITYEEINNFTNFSGLYSRLPVVMTITCEFTVWDLPYLPSAGVYMYKVPQGGASAMLTTSRPVYVSYGEVFNEKIVEQVLKVQGDKYQSLGEALTHAKANNPNHVNHVNVNLLGDPMLSVNLPPRDIKITKINGIDADEFDGILRAMDFVEIEGEVMDASGNLRDNSFNGKATASLFDKPVNKTTLNNRNDPNMPPMPYKEQVNSIFKGGTNVEYGKFKFQFYVPKDINYEVGEGKLTVYAHNNVIDGVSVKKVKVGDQNPDGLDDDEGPVIGLYMNNLNFVDGGITDRNPYLLACLVDDSGINTSGVAIGHDITGVLDQNVEGTYVLNEYYEGGDNNPCTNPQVLDYQKGQVMYRLDNLELGQHQIVVKAWDINNNSSTETLDFVVMEEGSEFIHIEKLLNWPNPFTNQTYFHFEHNCDSELDVMVQIFTISGKLVKTIRQPVSAEPWREGYRTGRFAIPWDGLDDFGDKIGKGVYIYRLTAKGLNPEECKGSATAVEKLVILK